MGYWERAHKSERFERIQQTMRANAAEKERDAYHDALDALMAQLNSWEERDGGWGGDIAEPMKAARRVLGQCPFMPGGEHVWISSFQNRLTVCMHCGETRESDIHVP